MIALRKFLLVISLLFYGFRVVAQTNPVAQPIPYSQDFGLTYFSTLPAGFAAWNSATSPNGSVTSAGNSVGSIDQTVDTAQVTKTTGDVYGFSGLVGGIPNNDGELYIQSSSRAKIGRAHV